MKKFLNLFNIGSPIPLFVFVGFAFIGIPIYYVLPDGYGEIPTWANLTGLIGGFGTWIIGTFVKLIYNRYQ